MRLEEGFQLSPSQEMQLRNFFYLKRPPRSPQKPIFVPTQFVNEGLVDELSNSKKIPMEAIEDRNKSL